MIRLEGPISCGAGRVAALVEQRCGVARKKEPTIIAAERKPVAILLLQDGAMTAYTLRGDEIDLATVEGMCPGALEEMQWVPNTRTRRLR